MFAENINEMKTLAAIALFASLILMGCRIFQKAGSDSPNFDEIILNSAAFFLESINGDQLDTESFSGNLPSISFHPEENKITGFAGCNRYFGSYEISDDSLSIGIIGATKMACNHLDLEQKFLSAIGEQKFRWSIEDEKLVLRNEKNVVILRKNR
jgi:heat shock protein HslJ